jgi:hypothetical protein
MVGIQRQEWNGGLASDPDGRSSSACSCVLVRVLHAVQGYESPVNASRGLRGCPPCRRCGQSHWPQPTIGPTQGLFLRPSAGYHCAGRYISLLWVSMRVPYESATPAPDHSSPPTPARMTVRPDASAVVAGSRRRTREAHARRIPPSWGFQVPVPGADPPGGCGGPSSQRGNSPILCGLSTETCSERWAFSHAARYVCSVPSTAVR